MTEKTAVLEEGSSETEEDSELKEGQRKAAIQIISITGNEMTYFEIEETEDRPETSEEKETLDTEEQSEPDTEKNGILTSETGRGTAGESGMTSGESQRGGREKGEAFNSGQTSGKELSGDFDPGQMGNRGMTARVARETKAVYIPVAVVVHTDLDEEMTFSILQAGDELEVLFEEVDGEEVITEIWMKSAEGEAE